MNIQWYPGHMTKTKRMIEEHIKLIDLVIEVVDARVPVSSINDDLRKLYKDKKRIILLNKIDLADDHMTKKWIEALSTDGVMALGINARDGKGMKQIVPACMEVCKERIERNKRRGLINKPIRAMIVGIPNVGKSTFINKLVGKSSAKTGNKPGVTRGKQWIKLKQGFELMDTPGMLWPKFEDKAIGKRLAMIGAIREEILDLETLGFEIIRFMKTYYGKQFQKKYDVVLEDRDPADIFMEITKQRNFIMAGEQPDYNRMSKVLFDEFKNGKLGKLTLDRIHDGEAFDEE